MGLCLLFCAFGTTKYFLKLFKTVTRAVRTVDLYLQISLVGGGLAEPFTNMRTSCRPRPGSVLCFRQRGLCGGGLCHAIRMCGSVLWVLRKSA